MKSLAVVRADDMSKVKTALCDLVRYAHLTFIGNARILEPAFADNILVSVMRSPLKNCCEAASIVSLEEDASTAIGRVKKIHPPAHVIIVSPRHEIYPELIDLIDILPEIELEIREKVFEDDMAEMVENNKAGIFRDNSTMVEDIRRRIEQHKRQIEDNDRKIEDNNIETEDSIRKIEDNIRKIEKNRKRTEDDRITKMLENNKTKTS